ncbi:MAG: hypothetical protein Q9202_007336 [Teloschistes flavicans]
MSLNKVILAHWALLERHPSSARVTKAVNGHRLDVATVVLVSRYNVPVEISEETYHLIDHSAKAFEVKAASAEVIYGINTGFGGSADTRTKATAKLKEDLLNLLQYGIVAKAESTIADTDDGKSDQEGGFSILALPLNHGTSTVMPESWIRASILVRLNSLAYGVSGVTASTVENLLRLLNHNLVPRVPLRGSISASGDLSPLAYIAGVLEGNPSLCVYVGERETSERRLERADIALNRYSITPTRLTAREGLGLVNGTSVSAAVAALAMHEALGLAALSQILTAMSVEALLGTDESFDPFLATVRPHWGQAESARNIYTMLKGSKLVDRRRRSDEKVLLQDRYSIRTASQWLGPALEDLSLANSQIITELNSATDNPLIDASLPQPRLLHGGNFQAKSITSAVEKIRQSAQSVGRLLYTQCNELINPATSRGLPPNLVAAEPSESFIFKGTDILIASLLSELGFLSNLVASHVQTAEMGNQAVNSLALISSRYTLDALDILCQLAAAHLVAVCQALDLRAMQRRFLESLEPIFHVSMREALHTHLKRPESMDDLLHSCWRAFMASLDTSTPVDSATRIPGAIFELQPLIIPSLVIQSQAFEALLGWTEHLGRHAVDLYMTVRNQYLANGNATSLLGHASKRMYTYLRNDLGIPFVGPNTLATPSCSEKSGKGVTMGALNGKVRAAMADGRLYTLSADCIKDVESGNLRAENILAKLW